MNMDKLLQQARDAQEKWHHVPRKKKDKYLLNWKNALVSKTEHIAHLIHQETGKPYVDAVLEVFAGIHHITHTIKRAKKVLRKRRVSSGLFVNYLSMIEYIPMGVIAIISPWNMPFSIAINQIVAAVSAGNSVILKPSEMTPLVAKIIVETALSSLPIDHVVQVVLGDEKQGKALIRSGVDKVAVTGGYETGQSVMRTAAETVTPVLLELGGKDALIVAADANVDKAARRAVWGSFVLAGQACISVERCYVVEAIYEAFLENMLVEVKKLTTGVNGDVPPMVQLARVEIIKHQVQDALNKGARLVHGSLEGIQGNVVPPLILTDVNGTMAITQEETFGPVLVVQKVPSLPAAVEETNKHPYRLGVSIFSRKHAMQVVEKMKVGMVSVNTVWAYALIKNLPFGGNGRSGFGRIHADAGLLEFSNTQSIAVEKFSLFFDLMSFSGIKRIPVSWMIKIIKFLY